VTSEYEKLHNCEECESEFEVGDLVVCMIDPLYLAESRWDCGREPNTPGVVIDIHFYKESLNLHHPRIVCELEVYWFSVQKVTYHLDKYVKKIA
tara:strand:+ start:173 stop:454 length:282 start_codon:yes stop_codon:yes gene_type:complete